MDMQEQKFHRLTDEEVKYELENAGGYAKCVEMWQKEGYSDRAIAEFLRYQG